MDTYICAIAPKEKRILSEIKFYHHDVANITENSKGELFMAFHENGFVKIVNDQWEHVFEELESYTFYVTGITFCEIRKCFFIFRKSLNRYNNVNSQILKVEENGSCSMFARYELKAIENSIGLHGAVHMEGLLTDNDQNLFMNDKSFSYIRKVTKHGEMSILYIYSPESQTIMKIDKKLHVMFLLNIKDNKSCPSVLLMIDLKTNIVQKIYEDFGLYNFEWNSEKGEFYFRRGFIIKLSIQKMVISV